jgi:hypothetical protein
MPIESIPEPIVEQVVKILAYTVTHTELTEIHERIGIEAPP